MVEALRRRRRWYSGASQTPPQAPRAAIWGLAFGSTPTTQRFSSG